MTNQKTTPRKDTGKPIASFRAQMERVERELGLAQPGACQLCGSTGLIPEQEETYSDSKMELCPVCGKDSIKKLNGN